MHPYDVLVFKKASKIRKLLVQVFMAISVMAATNMYSRSEVLYVTQVGTTSLAAVSYP